MAIATGQQATAADVNAGLNNINPTKVRKTVDEIINNSNTLQNDDELLLAIAANEIWEFTAVLLLTTATASAFKCTFTVPAAATGGFLTNIAEAFTNTSLLTAFATSVGFVPVSPGDFYLRIDGIIINSTNAGNLQFQWAQNTAVAEDTKVLTNSYLIAHKLN